MMVLEDRLNKNINIVVLILERIKLLNQMSLTADLANIDPFGILLNR